MVGLKVLNDVEVTKSITEKSDNEKDIIENDYLEQCIGAIGNWQICVSFAAALTRYIAIGNMTAIVFLTAPTDFMCVEFKHDNASTKVFNNSCYDRCIKYVYHSDVMETTLLSDFKLICEKEWLSSFTQTALMFGLVLGSPIFGWISDRSGRRIAIISSTIINTLSMICASFKTNFWIFTSLRFVSGIASGGCLIVCISIIMEIFGKQYREVAGASLVLPDAFAQAALVLYAYFLRTWNGYFLGLSITGLAIQVLVFFVPESPRWLIARGRVNEAIKVMTRAAKFNKLSTDDIKDIVIKNAKAIKIIERKELTYVDFFKYKSIRIMTILCIIIWFIVGITYYGIYQYLTLINVNVYVSVLIMGLIQVPLCPCEIFLTKLFSRRICVIVPFIITSSAMLILIFIPTGHWSGVVFGVIGFAASSFCFVTIYILQAELFPTSIRNMSFGLCCAAGKIGSMVAPFIATISPQWIPSVIFSGLSIIAASSCLLLPETKGKNLKDTID